MLYRRNQVFGLLMVAAAICCLVAVSHQSQVDLSPRLVAPVSPLRRSRRSFVGRRTLPRSTSRRLWLVLILGPTGSGKTALSLALAERFGGEIVSCDSVAVYRGMDLGTAKPTPRSERGFRIT